MPYTEYRDLLVWQKGMDLVAEVYRLVKLLPKEETYALSDQMRRAVVSIPSNIAEGHGRGSANEFVHFLTIAQGSRAEVETQLQICLRLQYLTERQISAAMSLSQEVGRMLTTLIRRSRG